MYPVKMQEHGRKDAPVLVIAEHIGRVLNADDIQKAIVPIHGSLVWFDDIACHNATDGIDQHIDNNQREGHDVGAARGKARSHDLTANLWWRLPGPLWRRVLPAGINGRRF